MSEGRIQVANLSKAFARGEKLDSLYSVVARRFARPFRRESLAADQRFWALEDISLEVRGGECLGVIGHNGAGKSTLLKLLAGIMRPDRGWLTVNGRVSALIEVGAGFHPSLTGRENVYLNASILGISQRRAEQLFDSIVDFAEVRDHIDAPIKHFSSGMFARLGFSIAVHAEPDVLLVDEVLSVGDRQFRARCIERMQGFLDRGVAIVFVSHDLETVQRFCGNTLVLSGGRSLFLGDSATALKLYHRSTSSACLLTDESGGALVEVKNVLIRAGADSTSDFVSPGQTVTLEYDVISRVRIEEPSFGLSLVRSRDRLTVYESSSTRLGCDCAPIEAGESRHISCQFTANATPGDYAVGIHVRERNALRYLFEDVDLARLEIRGEPAGEGPAFLDPREPDATPVGRITSDSEVGKAPASTDSPEFLSAGLPSQWR